MIPEGRRQSSGFISLPRSYRSGVLEMIGDLKFTGTAVCGSEMLLLTKLLALLPGLESLSISNLRPRLPGSQGACLGTSLSNLQDLQRLQCESVDVELDDGTWKMPDWLKRIEVLELTNCYPLQKHEILQLLSSPFSSQLRELHLRFGRRHTPSNDERSEVQLNLPFLTTLSLKDTKSCDLLSNFQTCQQITRISLCATPTQGISINKIICSGNWPNLDCLEILYSLGPNEPVYDNERGARKSIQRYCECAGIKFVG